MKSEATAAYLLMGFHIPDLADEIGVSDSDVIGSVLLSQERLWAALSEPTKNQVATFLIERDSLSRRKRVAEVRRIVGACGKGLVANDQSR